MNIPFIKTKTAQDAIAPLKKILDDLETVVSHHAAIVDNEDIAIQEARSRRAAAKAEAEAATRFAEKLVALLS